MPRKADEERVSLAGLEPADALRALMQVRMEDPTAEQEASRQMAERVFADPELAEHFRTAAKRTLHSDPVPDDFGRLDDLLPPTRK